MPQILDILDPHRQADQAVADAQPGPLFGRDAGVRHQGRVLDQAFHAAQAFGQGEHGAAFQEAPRARQVGIEVDRDDAAETVHLALRQRVLRVGGQARIKHGFDIVVHATTQYLNGHSDLIGGIAIVGAEERQAEWREQLGFLQNSVGAIAGPFDSFLALRGVKTLAIRMQRHCESALALAQWLEQQKEVKSVFYPGLASHPQHQLAQRQMDGFGGIISIDLDTDRAGARRFLERCEVFALAESLGGVESLIEHPALMTHASIPPEQRAKLGIGDGLIRLSVGIEDIEDLRHDLRTALDAI